MPPITPGIRRGLKSLSLLACIFVAASSSVLASSPAEHSPRSAGCPTQSEIPAPELQDGANAITCALIGRVVVLADVAVYVPVPGEGISAEAESVSGALSLNVETSLQAVVTATFRTSDVSGPDQPRDRRGENDEPVADGSDLSVDPDGDVQAGDGGATAGQLPKACYLSDNHFNGWTWDPNKTARFLVNTTEGRPPNISAATFLSVQKSAARRIATGYNDCNLDRDPGIDIAFAYRTSRHSNINGVQTRCAARGDNRNVVDFGNLLGGILALNCTRYANRPGWVYDIITESDTRMDNSDRIWITSTRNCTANVGNKYDLLAVATHEFGHWVGIGHVLEEADNDLTMSTNTMPCNKSARTLGKGDVTALTDGYGWG
jgi:matrixin